MACLLEILKITGPSHRWPHSDHEVELLSCHYGAQMTANLLDFAAAVYGVLPTSHPARLLQLNRFVTTGVTPSGEPSEFNTVFRSEIKAATNTKFSEGSTLYRDKSKHQSIRSVINTAGALAVDIRTNQYFKDGNHRTSILALVLHLAEHGVVLTYSFHVYRAYTILSTRFHPGNESNALNAVARADVYERIVRYLRRRTIRGVASVEYLATLADTVRQLPVIVSHAETVGVRLRGEWEHGGQTWSTLDWAQKVVVRWTFPELSKGRTKMR